MCVDNGLSEAINLYSAAACAPSVALSYEESDFAIKETRFQNFEDGLNQCSFQVWGVASVLLGEDNSNNQYYWFDCFHGSLSTGSTWVRIDPEGSVDNTGLTGGIRMSFTSQTSNYLGLYACRASDGSMEYLNTTDGMFSVALLYCIAMSTHSALAIAMYCILHVTLINQHEAYTTNGTSVS